MSAYDDLATDRKPLIDIANSAQLIAFLLFLVYLMPQLFPMLGR